MLIGFKRYVFLLALALVVGCSSVSEGSKSLVGQRVPEGRMMLLSGETVALHDNSDVSRAILFWATWCPRSRSDIERFEDLARLYSWRGDIEFYAVSIDKHEDERELLSRIESQDLKTVRHVFSGNDTQDESFLALRGDQLPYAVLIDRRGVVRSITVGVSGLEELLTKKLPSRRPVADE